MRNPCIADTSPDTSPDGSESDVLEGSVQRPLLLTVRQAADLVGVGRTTMYKLMEAGELPSVHVGASRRIPLSAVYNYVESLCRSEVDVHGGGPA
jgi:excisionase family DNA binding protein